MGTAVGSLQVVFFCFMGYEMIFQYKQITSKKKKDLRRIQLVSSVLFVIENITMILLFYFSHFPHTWYSLPVTICVCLFTVLGAIMRLTHFYFLSKKLNDNSDDFYV